MATRIDLFDILRNLMLGVLQSEYGMDEETAITESRKRVFYEAPPETVKLTYPCIIYKRRAYLPKYANNGVYALEDRYDITVISKDPDSSLPREVAGLPRCRHDRHYTADNLLHDAYTIIY